jgi:hypothetical protein
MNALLALSALAVAVSVSLLFPAEGAAAVVFCAALSALVGLLVSRHPTQARFLVHVFVAGLLVRVAVGALIFYFNLQDFFGGDAFTYDYQGLMYLEYWQGLRKHSELFGASMRICCANARIAGGESNGWLKPMLTTLNASAPKSWLNLATASASERVVVGQIWKQPV